MKCRVLPAGSLAFRGVFQPAAASPKNVAQHRLRQKSNVAEVPSEQSSRLHEKSVRPLLTDLLHPLRSSRHVADDKVERRSDLNAHRHAQCLAVFRDPLFAARLAEGDEQNVRPRPRIRSTIAASSSSVSFRNGGHSVPTICSPGYRSVRIRPAFSATPSAPPSRKTQCPRSAAQALSE